MKCIEDCGADVPEGNTHCRNCGAPQEQSEVTQGPATPEPPPPQAVSLSQTAPGDPPAAVEPAPDGTVEAATIPAAVGTDPPVPPKPTTIPIKVETFCQADIGHIRKDDDDHGKENNQDYVRTEVIDFPTHGFQVVLAVGADGIGSSTGGERMSQAAVDLFLGVLGARVPVFSTQDSFMDRLQFGEMLASKIAKWFFPAVDWTHKMIHSIGEAEFPVRKGKRQLYGSTFVAAAMICDLKTGRVIIHGYWAGDSRIYLITRDKIEQLTEDHDREQGGEKVLTHWVGNISSADGQVFTRELQLNPESLPFLQLLLCSDGLTNMLGDAEIAEVCRTYEPTQAVETLISRAKNCAVPYGRQFQSKTAIAIQPGDDNIFANLTAITGA